VGNYALQVVDCEVTDLDVNHSFNFMTVSKGTFADHVLISGSEFSNVSGAILEFDRETDDLGLYNVEYVTIEDSQFTDIGEALAVLYRCCTDESTFGPHLAVRNNAVTNLGHSKRNRSGASISLVGVQVADVEDNHFINSRPIRVRQTVGDPVTRISGNRFEATPSPVVEGGPATVTDNTVSELPGDSG
jgi:poly(beta-D-mannuronate) lyase